MAKSTRSKVKRHFRAKKREEGVYAAAEAARLNRLHTKLRTKMLAAPEHEPDEGRIEADEEAGAQGEAPSWFAYQWLGLADPGDITAERMWGVDRLLCGAFVRGAPRGVAEGRAGAAFFDYLFPEGSAAGAGIDG